MFKINFQGEILYQKYSKYFSNQYSNSIFKDGEDIYMVISNKKLPKDHNTRLYIYHTNTNADSLEMIRINHEDSIYSQNRGIIKIGNSFYLLNYVIRDIDKAFPWKIMVSQLIKVHQKDGEVEVLREFDYFNTPENIYVNSDSNLVLFQHQNQHKNPDGTGSTNDNVAELDILDTLGNSIIHKEIIYPRENYSKLNLVITSDGNYVINLSAKNDSSKIHNYLIKLDKTGNQLWRYDLLISDTSRYLKETKIIDGLYCASNGDILGFGLCDNYKLYGDSDNIKYIPWIFRLNGEGKLLWQRFLFEDLENVWFGARFYSIIEDSDNSLLLVGDYTPYNQDTVSKENKYFSFVVKLDSMGCFLSDCDTNVLLNLDWLKSIDALREYSIENIKIYPNPSFEYIKVKSLKGNKFVNWKIYNISGKCVMKGLNLNTGKIDISSLYSGIFFIQIFNENGEFSVEQFIKI